MKTSELKRQLVQFIGDLIDKQSLPGHESFMEMDQAVIHFVGDGVESYFCLILVETNEADYFKPYDPERDNLARFTALLKEVYDYGEDSDLHERIREALGIMK